MRAKLKQLTPNRLCMQIQGEPTTIFWEVPCDANIDLNNPSLGNFIALSAFPFAMKKSLDLELRGPVDYLLVSNLTEFSAAWCQYRPTLFKTPVKIIADEFTSFQCRHHNEVNFSAAFSGGIDSTFLLICNASNTEVDMHPRISQAIMIDGFGFNLENIEQFRRTFQLGSSLCDSIGVELLSVRTNWSKVIKWYEIFHTLGIASLLNLLSRNVAGGYIGLDFTYAEEFELGPWGNMAGLDRMLSASSFPILPFGGQSTRIGKLTTLSLSGNDRYLSVCNSPGRTSINCGTCEKCQRTMLEYMSQGITPAPGLFGSFVTLETVAKIKIRKPTQKLFYQAMEAEWLDRSDPYLAAVQHLLERASPS